MVPYSPSTNECRNDGGRSTRYPGSGTSTGTIPYLGRNIGRAFAVRGRVGSYSYYFIKKSASGGPAHGPHCKFRYLGKCQIYALLNLLLVSVKYLSSREVSICPTIYSRGLKQGRKSFPSFSPGNGGEEVFPPGGSFLPGYTRGESFPPGYIRGECFPCIALNQSPFSYFPSPPRGKNRCFKKNSC